ncbi:hypothetical protein C8F01DRAFT_1121620 [Mycena amicta]|nr:hypothetical protein C8F01DRAFT_1121620 [Mycena amicta]
MPNPHKIPPSKLPLRHSQPASTTMTLEPRKRHPSSTTSGGNIHNAATSYSTLLPPVNTTANQFGAQACPCRNSSSRRPVRPAPARPTCPQDPSQALLTRQRHPTGGRWRHRFAARQSSLPKNTVPLLTRTASLVSGHGLRTRTMMARWAVNDDAWGVCDGVKT